MVTAMDNGHTAKLIGQPVHSLWGGNFLNPSLHVYAAAKRVSHLNTYQIFSTDGTVTH